MLDSAGVRLRPISRRDREQWQEVRSRNRAWLSPWDATPPSRSTAVPRTFAAMVRALSREAAQGRQLPWVVEVEGRLVGQLTVNNIVRGSAQFGSVGYWIDQRHAGQGIMPRAVAMAIDHCFGPVGLHRVEIAIRPTNTASLRIVEKLGLTHVGTAPSYLHIDGAWRDHELYAVVREDVPLGIERRLDRWLEQRRSQQSQE